MSKYRSKTFSLSLIVFIFLFFLCSTIIPLMMNLYKIQWDVVPELLKSPLFKESIFNSIIVALNATIISTIVGFLLAYMIQCTYIRYKSIWKIIFTLPMLMPSISHGLGLANLFGDNGLINTIFGININIYGYVGVLIASILYTVPIAMLMFIDALNFLNKEVYDSCKTLGIPKLRIFIDITVASLKKAIVMIFFTIFTLIFTDYGIALAIGGKFNTLAIFLYREVIGLLDFSKGGFIALILIMPAILTFIIDFKLREDEKIDTSYRAFCIPENKIRDKIAYVICILAAISILIPIIASVITFLVKQYPVDMSFSLEHIFSIEKELLFKYLKISIVVALSTALVGTALAYLIAYMTTRIENKILGKMIHLLSLMSLVIPGVVLGLGYIQLYRGTFLYGTTLIIILVNIAHFFSTPYLLAYNALNKMGAEFDQVAKSLGISKWSLVQNVFIPSTVSTIVEMFVYFFINSMVTISAISFLANTKNMPIALMITEYENQLMFEYAAMISTVILLCNILFKLVVYKVKKYIF